MNKLCPFCNKPKCLCTIADMQDMLADPGMVDYDDTTSEEAHDHEVASQSYENSRVDNMNDPNEDRRL